MMAPAAKPPRPQPQPPRHRTFSTAPDAAFLSAGFPGIADALVAVTAMPAPQSSAAASFVRFDMLVSSGISAWIVATRELLSVNSGRGVSVPGPDDCPNR